QVQAGRAGRGRATHEGLRGPRVGTAGTGPDPRPTRRPGGREGAGDAGGAQVLGVPHDGDRPLVAESRPDGGEGPRDGRQGGERRRTAAPRPGVGAWRTGGRSGPRPQGEERTIP